MSEDRRYEGGRLASRRVGDRTTSYAYDEYDRPTAIEAPDQRTAFVYGDNGLSMISARRGEFEAATDFVGGRPVARRSTSGLADSFAYDEDGALLEVARADGEHWTIKRGDRAMAAVRNGVPQFAFAYDAQGRLTELRY